MRLNGKRERLLEEQKWYTSMCDGAGNREAIGWWREEIMEGEVRV
jgi:hypothetical protein